MVKQNISKQYNNVKKYQKRNRSISMLCIEKITLQDQINNFMNKLIKIKCRSYKVLENALKLNPDYGSAWFQKGASLQQTDQLIQLYITYNNKAITCYDKTIQLNPYLSMANNNKGLFSISILLSYSLYYNSLKYWLECLKQYDEALKRYKLSIFIDYTYSQAYKNKGDLLRIYLNLLMITKMKKYKEAIKVYEQAIRYCTTNQDEFKKLFQGIKNKK